VREEEDPRIADVGSLRKQHIRLLECLVPDLNHEVILHRSLKALPLINHNFVSFLYVVHRDLLVLSNYLSDALVMQLAHQKFIFYIQIFPDFIGYFSVCDHIVAADGKNLRLFSYVEAEVFEVYSLGLFLGDRD
jgi:hypothetical protein